jgi:hypothetical protein
LFQSCTFAVELPHNQRVAAARKFQRLAQGWSIRHPPNARTRARLVLLGASTQALQEMVGVRPMRFSEVS